MKPVICLNLQQRQGSWDSIAVRNEIVEAEIVTWEVELNWESYLQNLRKQDSLYPHFTYRNTNPGSRTLRKIHVVLYVWRTGKVVPVFQKKKGDKNTFIYLSYVGSKQDIRISTEERIFKDVELDRKRDKAQVMQIKGRFVRLIWDLLSWYKCWGFFKVQKYI